jgi:hypothetical protein
MGPSLMHLTYYGKASGAAVDSHSLSHDIQNQKSIHDMEAQSFPTTEKFIAKASASKFMATVFWGDAGQPCGYPSSW